MEEPYLCAPHWAPASAQWQLPATPLETSDIQLKEEWDHLDLLIRTQARIFQDSVPFHAALSTALIYSGQN